MVEIQNRSFTLPRPDYDIQRGFTFLDRLSTVHCDPKDKQALCKKTGTRTTFTKEVFSSAGNAQIRFKVSSLSPWGPFVVARQPYAG